MARGIVIIICTAATLVWPHVALGQGTIYKWVDGKGTAHYSDTPTGEARSINDELPPAASFATQPDTALQSETQPPALPAQGMTADAAADATEREEPCNQWAGEAEGDQVGQDEGFALGRDGPFSTDNGNAFED